MKNETEKKLEANFHYFRDEAGTILEKDKVMVEHNESYTIEKKIILEKMPKNLKLHRLLILLRSRRIRKSQKQSVTFIKNSIK